MSWCYRTRIERVDATPIVVDSLDEPEMTLDDAEFVRISFSSWSTRTKGNGVSLKDIYSDEVRLLRRGDVVSVTWIRVRKEG